MEKGFGCSSIVFFNMPLQCSGEIRGNASGLVDWTGASHLQEGVLKGCFNYRGLTLLSLSRSRPDF